MSSADFTSAPAVQPSAGLVGAARRAENLLLTVALLALVALPLTEALLRRLIHGGITGSAVFVQHFTLIATMLGAAAAARDGRLLTLFEFATFASPRVRALSRVVSSWGAALIDW